MNTVMRTLGGALGGQIVATFLANDVSAHGLPTITAFTRSWGLEAGFLVVAVLAGLLVPGPLRARTAQKAELELRGDLASAGKSDSSGLSTRRPRSAVSRAPSARPNGSDGLGDNYKWIALSNCTLGVLLATLDASITLIAMPDIFRGIKLDPLVPANSFYLLWMILGFLVVSSVLIVSLGRLGDMYGRVRIYNLGSSSTPWPRWC